MANFIICTIGIGINAVAICILFRQKTSSLFVKLMISLVSYDLLYVFLFATCFSLPRLYPKFEGNILLNFFHVVKMYNIIDWWFSYWNSSDNIFYSKSFSTVPCIRYSMDILEMDFARSIVVTFFWSSSHSFMLE